jgi:hypothetical protein
VADDQKAMQALNLALAGVDWTTIADKLRFPDPADAMQAALDIADQQYDGLPMDPARVLEILRLNRLQAAVWPAAVKGDIQAVTKALDIGDRRIRLLRLTDRSGP